MGTGKKILRFIDGFLLAIFIDIVAIFFGNFLQPWLPWIFTEVFLFLYVFYLFLFLLFPTILYLFFRASDKFIKLGIVIGAFIIVLIFIFLFLTEPIHIIG